MKATNKLKMKKLNQGITLVSLVVTIIILIILAGISINLTLGEEGIFTLAQRAKENMELAQIEEQEKLNSLYTEFDFNTEGEGGIVGNSYDVISDFLQFRIDIADAIKEAGGTPPTNPIAEKESTPYADSIRALTDGIATKPSSKPLSITCYLSWNRDCQYTTDSKYFSGGGTSKTTIDVTNFSSATFSTLTITKTTGDNTNVKANGISIKKGQTLDISDTTSLVIQLSGGGNLSGNTDHRGTATLVIELQ